MTDIKKYILFVYAYLCTQIHIYTYILLRIIEVDIYPYKYYFFCLNKGYFREREREKHYFLRYFMNIKQILIFLNSDVNLRFEVISVIPF